MRTVRIEKEKLTQIVQKNRDNHRQIFEEATEGYRAKAIEELDKNLALAKAGKRFLTVLHLIEPVDQTREYDKVLRMLQLTEDTIIELTDQEFTCYVLDRWQWRDAFYVSNATYSAKAAQDYENER